jgi:hypothetical protein
LVESTTDRSNAVHGYLAAMAPRKLERSLEEYAAAVRRLPAGALSDEQVRVKRFLLAREGDVEVFWAPFDHVNRKARVVLVGITPGATQMRASLEAARDALVRGVSPRTAARHAKTHASFSGRMRDTLVAWLDGIGLARRFDLRTSAELWDSAAALAAFTSTLRYPVFKGASGTAATRACSPLPSFASTSTRCSCPSSGLSSQSSSSASARSSRRP